MNVVVTGGRVLPGEAAGGAGRLAHALATLAAAEQRTGVRQAQLPVRAPAAASVVPGSSTVAPATVIPRVAAGSMAVAQTRRFPVQPALAALLPDGVLPVAGTLAVRGSTSLLLGLLAAASREGAWIVFVGAPAVGMLAASDAGLVLERVALVPDPGPGAPAVVAALLDGVDVVVAGPRAALLDADRRRLAARARERGALLASTTPWPGAHVTLDACGGSWWGAEDGAGWLRRRTLRVLRTGRGAAAQPVELEVEVPVAVPSADELVRALRPVETIRSQADPATPTGSAASAASAAGTLQVVA